MCLFEIFWKSILILKWQFSQPFSILYLLKSLPFYIPLAWKRYPFRAEPPHIVHYRKCPPPGAPTLNSSPLQNCLHVYERQSLYFNMQFSLNIKWYLSYSSLCNGHNFSNTLHVMWSSRKYPYLIPPRKVCCFAFPPPPQGNSVYYHTLLLKSLAFKSPFPLGISNDLPWGGFGYFLEPHNYQFHTCLYIPMSFIFLCNGRGYSTCTVTLIFNCTLNKDLTGLATVNAHIYRSDTNIYHLSYRIY